MRKKFFLNSVLVFLSLLILNCAGSGQKVQNLAVPPSSTSNLDREQKQTLNGNEHLPQAYPLLEKVRATLPEIQAATDIPVLVPTMFPKRRSEQPLFVAAESNRNMYKITVGTKRKCGSNSCLVAVLMAERNADAPSKDDVDKTIHLAKGVEGFYSAESCGTSCSPPQVAFVYKNVLYTFQVISSREGDEVDERQIVEMVNSALSKR